MHFPFSLIAADAEEEGEESKWQDRISSGFDRLVAFASTELDKRRRSTEGGDSCNTSPDSGIGHSEPSPAPQNLPVVKKTEPYKVKPNLKSSMFKTPRLKRHLDSPPTLEQFADDSGPPRTPSPSASPNCNHLNYLPMYHQQQQDKIRLNPALFKYQRQETEKKQSRPDQHYKKKFYYREWNNRQEGNWESEADEQTDADNSQKGKFQQKTKDWDCYKETGSGFSVNKIQNDNQWPRNNMDIYNVSNNWKN